MSCSSERSVIPNGEKVNRICGAGEIPKSIKNI
jgi:hypothetical protein